MLAASICTHLPVQRNENAAQMQLLTLKSYYVRGGGRTKILGLEEAENPSTQNGSDRFISVDAIMIR